MQNNSGSYGALLEQSQLKWATNGLAKGPCKIISSWKNPYAALYGRKRLKLKSNFVRSQWDGVGVKKIEFHRESSLSWHLWW